MTKGSIRRIFADDIRNSILSSSIESVEIFLQLLGEPTWIFFPGKSSSQCRVVTTLLHGNEPSGSHGVLRLIKENYIPAYDSWILIASIDAALQEPIFSRRYIEGEQDLNRCFNLPSDTKIERLAEMIVKDISSFKPYAVIDVHNTSGAGPGFCVSTSTSTIMDQLACIFTNSLVITDIRLNALMEVDLGCPVITVECGGNHSELSHLFAYNGIHKFLSVEDLSHIEVTSDLQHYWHPLRLELKKGYMLDYGKGPVKNADITLCHSVEFQNFGTTVPEKRLGWLGSKGLDCLLLKDTDNNNLIEEYFENNDGELHTKKHLHLFMVTTIKTIAETDCLFYLSSVETS